MNKPEAYSPEDEAAVYVMGGMTAEERCEFQSRLAVSAELRALVRELEEGGVALALASPMKQPPRFVWSKIEEVVGGEARDGLLPRFFKGAGWWQGWAVATACLTGWLLYALWVNWLPRPAAPARLEASVQPEPGTPQTETGQAKTSDAKTPASAGVDAAQETLRASVQEAAALRSHVAELENRVARLSQAVTQQEALLGETNRLKFVNLIPVSNTGQTDVPVKLSPDLQRAMDLAVAHELGWTQSSDAVSGGVSGIGGSHSLTTNLGGVDFVDFRPSRNGLVNVPDVPVKTPPQTEDAAASPAPAAPTTAPGGAIPAFISGNSLMMAIDSTIAAKGSQLTFVTSTPEQGQQTLGTAVLGDNPTVFAIPLNSGNGGAVFYGDTGLPLLQPANATGVTPTGWGVSIFAGTASGYSNVFQYYIAGTNAP